MRAFDKTKRIMSRIFGVTSTTNYTDYPNWIRSKEVASRLKTLLARENSCYAHHNDEDFNQNYLAPHLSIRITDNSNEILRAATFEIYLRKVHGLEI